MSKYTDIEKMSKRMPYKINDNLFEDMRKRIADELQLNLDITECEETNNCNTVSLTQKDRRLKIISIVSLAIAACMTLFLVISLTRQSEVNMMSVEQAYENLSQADQNYIMQIYQDDVLLNEE